MNHNPTENNPGEIHGLGMFVSTEHEDMAAFDQLPPRLRRALSAVPYNLSAVSILNGLRDFTENDILYSIDRAMAAAVAAEQQERAGL